MKEKAFNLQCMVLPKGLEGENGLRVTLALAPHAEAMGPDFNLPTVLRGLREVSLFIADGKPDVLGTCIATAAFGDEQKRVLDPGLWTQLMCGVQANPVAARARLGATAAATPPDGAAWQTSHAVSIIEALNQRPVPIVAAKAAQNGAQRRLAPLRRSHALAWPTVSAKRTTAKGAVSPGRADLDPLAIALQHAHQLFVHSENTVDALADRLNDLTATTPEDKEWRRLLAGYSTERNKSPGELLRDVALRPNQATVEWLRRRIGAARGQATEQQTFGDMVLDQLLFSAPHVPYGAARDGALKAQSDADDASMENRLAALANEFVLHPMLGLSIDLVFTFTITAADLRARLVRDQVRICVDLGLQPAAHQPWTMLSPDAWPLARGRDASVFEPRADGWCRMGATVLSNQDLRSSIARWRSALIAGLASHPGVVDSLRPVQVTPPPMQTSALVLQLPMLSKQTNAAIKNGGLNGYDPERLNLEDLVVGMRPMLEVTDTRDRRFAAPLLGREIDYPDIAPATRALATRLAGPPQSRDEGHIPVMRLSDPGEQQDSTAKPVGTDQVFEWNGWNPAVPIPGATLPRSAQIPPLNRLKKTIVARPGENLPYRYGLAVRTACRWVLRDGSSRLPAATAAGAKDAPWVGDGFILKRHEPLRAPMVLRQPDDIRTPLLESESATKVVLASLLDGHNVREASVRYIMPGAIRDLIDLDRHAAFDKGLPPTATAYPSFARGTDSVAPDKPESIFALQGREPMVVILPEQRSVANTRLIHPDPMTTRLRLVLVRTTVAMDRTDRQWYPVVDAQGQPLLAEFNLYDQQPWPWALALKVTFEARRRGDKQTVISSRPAVDGILPVRVGVPAGERYTLMVLPVGDPDRLARQHQFGGGSDVYDPQRSQITTISVQHVLQRPEPAAWTKPVAPPSRRLQERAADLQLAFEVDSGSTTQVDLHAGWTDPIDDPLRGLPTDRSGFDTLQSSMLVSTLGPLIGPASDAQIDDAASNLVLRPPVRLSPQVRHDMPDTRRRRFGYRLTTAGSSLLSDWDANQPGHGPVLAKSTDSATQWITVPASAPPLQPNLREIQLAFKFDRATFLTTSFSDRTCALSLVMERGWWSSGPGEKLAIVISPVLGPDGKTNVQSTWAADPIRRSAQPFMPNLASDDFAVGPRVEVIEVTAGQKATLVLFEPLFDELADAWRVDVELNVKDFQMQPFVQLVLARYQPEAVLGASLSKIVIADYFQLPSRRSATVKFLENETEAILEVTVTGAVDLVAGTDAERAAQSEAGLPRLWAVVQRTIRAGVGASVWIDTPCIATLLADPSHPGGRHVARIKVPPQERRGGVRVAIFEQTEFQTGLDATCAFGPMHYFDVVPMDLFEPPLPG